jgi:hypothetical protein
MNEEGCDVSEKEQTESRTKKEIYMDRLADRRKHHEQKLKNINDAFKLIDESPESFDTYMLLSNTY